jgi:hypothetical protein
MVEAGQDPLYIARRMVIFASEDIGMAQPTALVVANEVFKACEVIGYPECAINLAHGVVYLSKAKKDKNAYYGLQAALDDVRKLGNLPVPMNLRNAPTKLMKGLGRCLFLGECSNEKGLNRFWNKTRGHKNGSSGKSLFGIQKTKGGDMRFCTTQRSSRSSSEFF